MARNPENCYTFFIKQDSGGILVAVQATRFHLIDAVRGCAVVNMVAFHFLYDICIVWGKAPQWYGLPAVRLWQQAICWTFIFISGFVWPWGREKQVQRGVLLNLCGLAISAVTRFFIPEQTIWFGILNFIGCAALLLLPIHKAVQTLPPLLGAGSCFLCFLLCSPLPSGSIGIGSFRIPLPDALYSTKVLAPFGFPFPGFRSSDYFPILPWIFLYLCGFFCSRLFLNHPACRHAALRRVPALSRIGRKALLVYMFHQPVCMLVCFLLFSAH